MKKGGLSTLILFMPGHIHIASLYYYPVLREHGKKGVLCPPSLLGGNTGAAFIVTLCYLYAYFISTTPSPPMNVSYMVLHFSFLTDCLHVFRVWYFP